MKCHKIQSIFHRDQQKTANKIEYIEQFFNPEPNILLNLGREIWKIYCAFKNPCLKTTTYNK